MKNSITFMHMDYLRSKQRAESDCSAFAILFAHTLVCVRVRACVFASAACFCGDFTGRGHADAVFAEDGPLAVQAAMTRTLALQRASFR